MEALDVYFNITSTSMQLMYGKIPWRGGREKDSKSMQILIEASTTLNMLSSMLMHLHVILWNILEILKLGGFCCGIVCGLCEIIDLQMFHWQVCLFMLVDTMDTIKSHVRRTLHCLMSFYPLWVTQCQILLQVHLIHKLSPPTLTNSTWNRLWGNINWVCKFKIYPFFCANLSSITWICILTTSSFLKSYAKFEK